MSLKQDTSRIEVKPFRMGFIFHSIIHCRAFCGDSGFRQRARFGKPLLRLQLDFSVKRTEGRTSVWLAESAIISGLYS